MTPSLEVWPTKGKEAPSPHEVRLALLDTNLVFQISISHCRFIISAQPYIPNSKSEWVQNHMQWYTHHWKINPCPSATTWKTCTPILPCNQWECSQTKTIYLGSIFLHMLPPQWNSPCCGEWAYPLRSFDIWLNWASQLQLSGQQIFSTVMSRPESILIRQV